MAELVGRDRIDDTPVHKAIREALANCLVNADYCQPRGVVIVRDLESLSISNPGGFRVPLATAMSGGVSDPRNATMLKMFNLLDIGERTGSGIPLIKTTWEKQGWPDVCVAEEFNPERVRTNLSIPSAARRPKSIQKEVGKGKSSLKTPQKTPQKIIDAIRANPFVGTQEMADIFGVERSTVARAVAKLKRIGAIRRIGPDKGGHWEVVE